ncbi:MAG: alpha/beta fold hydrolase [Candidatus Eremiobacteraeota bacterium]|nr:alpha/beta fold hydrolase [Candidatus Eremiobacteraeota bacterium]NNM92686.1 alpha/beta fold hydrolase [Candidatus Eremiobacteraeota bacterium]
MIGSIPVEEFQYALDMSGLDPASLGDALRAVIADAMSDPMRMTTWMTTMAMTQQSIGMNMLRRMSGESVDAVATPNDGDKRFADPAWRENPMLAGTLEEYLSQARASMQLVEGSRLPEMTKRKARFAMQMLIDMYAPSNVPWMNPNVIKTAMETGGQSLQQGLANYMDDMQNNKGMPRQVDTSKFKLGVNLAATPGRVVYRNELMELIAYEPQSAKVHKTPLLCSPPWINKYYVMDLAPGRSFVEWAVRHGHQTFMISYRNPDESLANVTMDDYLKLGPLAALDAIEAITGEKQTNIAALCLGGTLSYILLAYLTAHGQGDRVKSLSTTNTLIDFSEPGDLGVFTDEATISRLEKKMNERGYLESTEMAGTFDWMRANDLIWSYVVNNWYMGKQPPAFDILAWNGDSTRMPAAMHSQYLRSCYLRNAIVKPGAFTILGTPIDLGTIRTPLYVLGAENDHIAPWRSSFKALALVGSTDKKYTLTNAGHIAGIVNPPGGKKSWHWTKAHVESAETADGWLATTTKEEGSWWEDWARWIEPRGGEMVRPYDLPSGEPAPGPYVQNQVGAPIDPPVRKAQPSPAPAAQPTPKPATHGNGSAHGERRAAPKSAPKKASKKAKGRR